MALAQTTVYDTPGLDALLSAGGWSVAIACAAALAVVASAACGWRERASAPGGWPWLLGLRLGALASAAAATIGIERRDVTETVNPSMVVLLTDHSASMSLAAASDSTNESSRTEAVVSALDRLSEELASEHAVRAATFGVDVRYGEDASRELAAATRLGAAIDRVLSDFAGQPLAGVVVASDGGWNAGPDPAAAAIRAAERGVPIHTLGVGPLRERPSIGVRDVAAPSRVSARDKVRVAVTITANDAAGPGPHVVTLTLKKAGETGAIVSEAELQTDESLAAGLSVIKTEVEAPGPGEYSLIAEVVPTGPDRDRDDNRLTTAINVVEEPVRVLLVAGGPSRDYRFLRDQLFRDDLFTCDVLLQSAAGAVTQDAGRVLDDLPADSDGWAEYDVLVAIDVQWRTLSEPALEAMAQWVSRDGGGLVFVAGAVATPSAVRNDLPTPLRTALPVVLRDDPLALTAAIGGARDPRPVRVTPAGDGAEFLSPPEDFEWTDFEGFYAEPLPAEAKPGASVLARLGDGPQAPPLIVEHFVGAGRTVYVAAAESWRLRKLSTDWFTAWHAGVLRHAVEGRLRGAAAEGVLLFDREEYALGESASLRWVQRSSAGSNLDSYVARVTTGAGLPQEVPLKRPDGLDAVFVGTVPTTQTGVLEAALTTPRGEPMTATARVDIPSLESETVTQNVGLLRGLAEATGGLYFDLGAADLAAIAEQTAQSLPSQAETELELGPPDEAFARRFATGALSVMAGCLLLEWTLRRAWRLA